MGGRCPEGCARAVAGSATSAAPAESGRAGRDAASRVQVQGQAPLVLQIVPRDAAADIDRADDATWQKLASLHIADAVLDASSIALIRSQNPGAYREAGALDRTVEKLQQSIALDTVHNNYQLRRRILSWLKVVPGQVHVENLNRRVYAELFLTPASDPWLGSAPEGTYTGLQRRWTGDGVSKSRGVWDSIREKRSCVISRLRLRSNPWKGTLRSRKRLRQ